MRLPGGGQKDRGEGGDLMTAMRRRYIDDLVDVYVVWREACGAVAEAYANWKCAGRQEQTLAFSEYVAALNCEEEAALLYREAVEQFARSGGAGGTRPGESQRTGAVTRGREGGSGQRARPGGEHRIPRVGEAIGRVATGGHSGPRVTLGQQDSGREVQRGGGLLGQRHGLSALVRPLLTSSAASSSPKAR